MAAATKTRGPGRPPKNREEVRSVKLTVALTPGEVRALERYRDGCAARPTRPAVIIAALRKFVGIEA